MIPHRQNANRFIAQVEKLGYSAAASTAGTGTIYVTVDGFKARFADHGECYCREHISVDPMGSFVWQAVAAFCEYAEIAEPAHVKAARTRRAKLLVRLQAERAESEARAAAARAAYQPDAVELWIIAHDKAHLTGKKRKNARVAAKRALGLM